MENNLVGKKIRVDVAQPQGYFYSGIVQMVNEDELTIVDIKGDIVTILRKNILILKILNHEREHK